MMCATFITLLAQCEEESSPALHGASTKGLMPQFSGLIAAIQETISVPFARAEAHAALSFQAKRKITRLNL
jgi:hypothetical protein